MDQKVINYINENWDNVVRECKTDNGTLIAMPYKYTVPCIVGGFQEFYYWDTYFTNIGLIISDRVDLAIGNIDNMCYMVSKYGFMPNGNRTHYLNRSQPPFLSQMIREVYDVTGDKAWLEEKYEILKIEYNFWQTNRKTENGLNRYFGKFSSVEQQIEYGEYMCGRFNMPVPSDKETVIEYGNSMMSFSESGWDCTTRFGLRAHQYNGIDQNSLLYGLEKNMEYFSAELSKGEEKYWSDKAALRRDIMKRLLWDENTGFFNDYNFVDKKLNNFASVAAFYPLFTGLATKEEAESTVKSLKKIEKEFGVVSTEDISDSYGLQWDYPNGWACQQYIVIKSLINYGYKADALRLAEKYVKNVDKTFEETNNLWEKYDVVCGGVSASKEYETPPMMGWSAGVYLYCTELLK